MTATPASLLGFEYQALIDDISKKSIGFQSTISKDCSQQELDEILDKCRVAVTRQRIFAEIEAKTIDLRNIEESLVLGRKDLVESGERFARELAEEDRRYADRADEHPGRAARGLSTAEQKIRQEKILAGQKEHDDKVRNINNGVAMCDSIKGKLRVLRSMVGQFEIVSPSPENPMGLSNGEQDRWSDNGGANAANL
jgi:hypothetical protein